MGNGSINIDEKVENIIGNKILTIFIKLEQGPCGDNMCQLIKKIDYEISDNYKYKDSYRIEKPVKIELQHDVYYSIDKERENVIIKSGLNKKIVIKGLTPVSVV